MVQKTLHIHMREDKSPILVIISKGQERSTDLIKTVDLLSRINSIPTPRASLHIHLDVRREKTKLGNGQEIQGKVPG